MISSVCRARLVPLFVAILALSLTSGCRKARITGEVFDGFGNPLEGATVLITGTQFEGRTDSHGRYSLPYAPGNFLVQYAMENHAPGQASFNLAQAARVPAQRMVLYRLPPVQGLYLVAADSYAALSTGGLRSASQEVPLLINDPDFYTKMAEGAALVESIWVEGSFAKVPQAETITILDNDGVDEKLFRLGGEDLINRRTYYRSMRHADEGNMMAERDTMVAPGVYLRHFHLPPGRYAFAAFSNQIRRGDDAFGRTMSIGRSQVPLQQPVYAFEITGS